MILLDKIIRIFIWNTAFNKFEWGEDNSELCRYLSSDC